MSQAARRVTGHPRTLTDEQVRLIRASTERGTVLAARYGVSGCTISLARRGYRYKWVRP